MTEKAMTYVVVKVGLHLKYDVGSIKSSMEGYSDIIIVAMIIFH